MKRTAKQCLYYLVILAMIAGTSRAQNESSGTARVSDEPIPLPSGQSSVFLDSGAPSGFFPMTPVERWFAPRYYVDSRAGTLYGYEESFTNIGAFLPRFIDDDAMVFADAKGMVGYDGRGGANLGLGYRYYMPELDRFFGLNAWYDFDASHIEEYHQVGVGFESIGRYFDMIVNGYIPVSNNSNHISTRYGNTATFLDNRIMLNRFDEWESAFTGFDANIGGPMPIFGRYGLQGYVGFYFFTNSSSNTDFTGVSGRLAWQVNEDFNIGVNFTDDHVFGTNTQMQFTMTIPDGKPSRWLRPLSVRDRMMQSVMRNNRVTVDREIRLSLEAARNPKDSQPYFVVHVDPNVAGNGVAAGDGTVENPYNLLSQFDNLALADKSEVDIIYVRPRFDETSTNLNEGVTLLSCQRLLSTSVEHFFEAEQVPGFQFTLPGHRPGDPLPRLTNDLGGDVVTFANGAFMIEVSGFEINGSATGRGIAGTNNRNVNINRNVISGARDGIYLTNLTGTQANDEGSFITSNIIRNNFGDGIYVENTGVGPLDLVIANNPPRTTNFDGVLEIDLTGDGIPDIGIPDSLDGDGSFANDGILANGDDGIDINANNGSLITLAIDNNIIRGNQDNGIELNATAGGTIRGAITDNVINGNQNNGIAMTAVDSTLDFYNLFPGGLQGEISGNEIRGNVDDGIEINAFNSTTAFDIHTNRFGVNSFNLNDPNLLVSQNGGWGINLNAEDGTTLIEIGGPTSAEGNLFLDPGFGAIIYNLSGNNVTESNVQFNRVITAVSTITGDVIRLGLDQFTLARGDNNSTGLVPVGFNGNFFGQNFNQVFVNNNGSITFNAALANVASTPLLAQGVPLIAPFYADVDTRNNGNPVTYGTGTVNGQSAFAVNWLDVDYNVSSLAHGNQLNSFQLVLIDRSDIAPGDFDIEFNYDTVLWETGATGGGVNGLGGNSARAGYTNGTNASFELPGSAVNGALLDSGPAATSLVQNSINSQLSGRYVFQSRNGTVLDPFAPNNAPPAGDTGAIVHNVTDTARLVNSFVQDNIVTGQSNANDNQFAFVMNTSGLGRVENIVVQRNTFNQNDGGMLFNRDNSSLLQAVVRNNTVNENRGNGWEINAIGTAVNGVAIASQDNVFNANQADGMNVYTGGNAIMTFDSIRDRWTNSGGDGIQTVSDDGSDLSMTFQNITSTGAAGSGFNAEVLGLSEMLLNISSPADPLFQGTRSSFSNNGVHGLGLAANESGYAVVNIDNTLFNANEQDGLNFSREGSSLLDVELSNLIVTNNNDDGIQFYTSGADLTDPNTPNYNGFVAPPSTLLVIDSLINNNGVVGAPNGGNGMEIATFAGSVLVMDTIRTTINNNEADGVRIFSGGSSSFGTAADRSTFDGVTINGNGRDGIRLFAMGELAAKPTQFVTVSSVTRATEISNNGDDGIQASVPYGTIDLNVIGSLLPNPNLQIHSNNGNGIEFNVADVAIDGDDVSDNITRANGDPDGAANEILNFFYPGGYEFISNQPFNGVGVLNVANAVIGDENINNSIDRGNRGSGIEMFVSNVENFAGTFPRGVVAQDVNRDGIDDVLGSGSAGVNRFALVNRAGQLTVNINNSSISGNGEDGLKYIGDGANDTFSFGNLITSTVTNSTISGNGRHGVNIDLEGKHGEYTFSTGVAGSYQVVSANQFTFQNNDIDRNNNYGIRYHANAGRMRRFNFGPGADTDFWSLQFQDNVQPTNPPGAFNPNFFAGTAIAPIYNFDSQPATGLTSDYYSIVTDLNSRLVMSNNNVRFNGQPGQLFGEGGDGLFVRVSTNAYLSADIGGAFNSGLGNTFSGNAISDVRFESFTATLPDGTPTFPNASTAAAAPTQDQLFLDDTAQLTLRFNNNTGRLLDADNILVGGAVGSRAAAYNQNNTAFIGNPGTRRTQMFQVDDILNLNTNNTFLNNLATEFLGSGGWRGTPLDPLFPNPLFPRDSTESPGDPFTP